MRWLPLTSILVACTPTDPRPSIAIDDGPPPSSTETASTEPARTEPVPAPAPAPKLASNCDPRTLVAARRAIATAIQKGVDAGVFADCHPEQIVCESERRPLVRSHSCQLFAYSAEQRWEIIIIPKPGTGVPTQLEIWFDESGTEAGRVDISGSTFGVLDGVLLEGHGEYASHTHGGEPARIGGASFTVENQRDQPIELELTGTRWLTAHSCELPRDERARPKPAGLALEDGLVDGSTMKATIPAHTTTSVSIGHPMQAAYMAYCDRFATAATFEIDGQAIEVIAEHHVVRREPLRRP